MSADVPLFDRSFGADAPRLSRIGRGELGGKASGLVALARILEEEFTGRELPGRDLSGIEVAIPRLVVLATGMFDEFVARNRLHELPLDELSDERIADAFQHGDLPVEMTGDLRAIVEQIKTPLAVRSSSLLEDALEQPFAGVYGTKMTPNNEHEPDARFRRLVEAIKFVWASTWFRGARDYRRAAGRTTADEKMAVIVQDVCGFRHGDRFYPDVSGVARSYNFYPASGARPEDGVVSLALGLGKTIVDGGMAWSYSPAQPARTPPFGSVQELIAGTQNRFYAVNMGKVVYYDPVNEVEFLVHADLQQAEEDGTLRYVASTYDGGRDRLVPGVGARGPRVLNFAPLLVLREFPLNDAVRALLAAGEAAAGAKVEIEFAAAIERLPAGDRRVRIGFLQVRPLAVSNEMVDIGTAELHGPGALVASTRAMGNGERDDLQDVVYVKRAGFDPLVTPEIAKELDAVNRALVDAGRTYVLVGFGRWGSSHPSLGIPVWWSQISNARAIVEATLPGMDVEPSQGSHFFHNLSAFRVAYFMVRHDEAGAIDWDALDALPAAAETPHVRHVRLPAPLCVRVDGRTGRGVILRA